MLRNIPHPALIQFVEATLTKLAVIDSVKRIDLIPSAEPSVSEGEAPSIELTSGRPFGPLGDV